MSDASNHTDRKDLLVGYLGVLMKKEQAEGNPFKARAYKKVVQQIAALPRVTTYEDLTNVTGIGEKIGKKIQKILETGRLTEAEEAQREQGTVAEAVDVLTTVYGIGPVKARQLVKDHGIRSVEGLRAAVGRDPSLLNDKQHIGLQYHEDLQQRIPRAEMARHEELLHASCRAHGLSGTIVGSYRRGLPDSGDIDVLLLSGAPAATARALRAMVQEMVISGYVLETLALGPKKFMGICRVPGAVGAPARRLDLLVTPPEEYPYAIYYFTGSQAFNIAVRRRALELGYTLNEHGMKPVADAVPVPEGSIRTERDIFAFLKLRYVSPERRVDEKSLSYL